MYQSYLDMGEIMNMHLRHSLWHFYWMLWKEAGVAELSIPAPPTFKQIIFFISWKKL